MKKLLVLIMLTAGFGGFAFAQMKIGPVIDLGYGFYSKTSDKITLKGGINPAFGATFDKYLNYWATVRGTATYAFKTLTTTRVSDSKKDKMNGQFVDLSLAGRFSDFDDEAATLPYGVAGLGMLFNVVSKGQESYMAGCAYNTAVPYFTVGAGTGIKVSFLSEFDISLNYIRYLAPMFTNPVDAKDARLNQISLKFTALF
jgi:hypothetical protein